LNRAADLPQHRGGFSNDRFSESRIDSREHNGGRRDLFASLAPHC